MPSRVGGQGPALDPMDTQLFGKDPSVLFWAGLLPVGSECLLCPVVGGRVVAMDSWTARRCVADTGIKSLSLGI